ncbi:MAG: potassium-transporting ATPase subunit KdpC [Actinomycetes bacterium]
MTVGLRYLFVALRSLLTLTVVLGIAYPLVVFGVGQLAFHDGANGSFLTVDGEKVGSRLIGQSFTGPEWFLPRPSAAGDGYDAMSSGASNLGPSSKELLDLVEQRNADAAELDGVAPADVPPDALTASGSGLDPHISPAYAQQQVARVAKARGLDPAVVQQLVDEHSDGRPLGFLGEPTVNVLELNLALQGLNR